MVSTIGQVTTALLEEIVSRCQVLSSSSMILMVTREAGLIGQSAICPLSTVPQNIRGRVAQNIFVLSQYAIWNKNINKTNKPQKFPLFMFSQGYIKDLAVHIAIGDWQIIVLAWLVKNHILILWLVSNITLSTGDF